MALVFKSLAAYLDYAALLFPGPTPDQRDYRNVGVLQTVSFS